MQTFRVEGRLLRILFYAIISGMLFGLFFALMSLGLNLLFGVMRMVNLAHGDFVMVGAFIAYVAYTHGILSPWLDLALVIVILGGLGFVLYFPIGPRLTGSYDPEMLSLILFFGVSQILEALAVMVFGNNPVAVGYHVLTVKPVNLLGQAYQPSWILAAGVSVIVILAVYGYLYHTRLGYATRAIMGDREESESTGINVHRVSAIVFALGLVTAGLAGVLSPLVIGSIYPTMGLGLTITAFAVVIIGSLGNPLGSILGGLIYGISLMLMETYLSTWSTMVPYVLLLLILLLRPTGLLGKGVRRA